MTTAPKLEAALWSRTASGGCWRAPAGPLGRLAEDEPPSRDTTVAISVDADRSTVGDEASFITVVSQWRVVVKIRSRVAAAGFSAALVIAGLAWPAASLAASQTCGGTGSVTTVSGTLPDRAAFRIQCPNGTWNGTLFLYSHGYVVPGRPNPAQDVGDPVTGAWLLSHGFALAGSSYATTGWAIQQALPDQITTLNVFDEQVGTPAQTIAWGHSLGGIITAGLIQDYPSQFSAALPMCGVLAGGVATWNAGLDGAFAFQQLI